MTDKIVVDCNSKHLFSELKNMAEQRLGKLQDDATRELKRTQLELEESRDEYRDKYRELYDFAPVGCLVLSGRGIVREINLTGASLPGKPRSELIGRGFGRFIAPESLGLWDLHIISVLELPTNTGNPDPHQSHEPLTDF